MSLAKRLFAATCLTVGLAGAAAAQSTQQRVVVFEGFFRTTCGYCKAAGPIVDELAVEYQSQPVVFIEHNVDAVLGGRSSRWWAASGSEGSVSLPLAMVDSGYRVTSGPSDFRTVFRGMVESAMARPALAEIAAVEVRSGNRLQYEIRLTNRSGVTLSPSNDATVQVIVYEEARAGVTGRMTRAVGVQSISSLAPGATTTASLETADLVGVDWGKLHAVVFAEYRPGGHTGPFEMLQAAPVGTIPIETTYALSVARDGTGTGEVRSLPSGIECGSDCTEDYPQGTVVTLTAIPATGSMFGGWSGACSGPGTCSVALSVARSVTATFNIAPVSTRPTITGMTPTAGPTPGGTVVTLTGTNFVAGQTTVAIGGSPATDVVVVSGMFLTARTPSGAEGPATVAVATAGGAASLAAGFTYQPATRFTRYLAEGATSPFFDTRFALVNPNSSPTTATVTYFRAGAPPVVRQLPVPALTRITVDPKSLDDMVNAEFATQVTSDQPLVVDRTMRWDASGYGAHAETALTSPATTWYLAEGATHSGFELFYLLQNPSVLATTVRVTYLRPSGPPVQKSYRLPPNSRTNIWVDQEDLPGLGTILANTDVSAVIESTDGVAFIVERAMYLSNQGRAFNAGHESAGVTAPALTWFLAEGATGDFFDLFILLANPNSVDAQVKVTYLLPDGTVYTKAMTVPAASRQNIWVDYDTPDGPTAFPLANTAVSTTVEVTNGVPIIVERAMWWPGDAGRWHEAHNSAGATVTGTLWALAEGEVGGAADHETYILVANTSARPGEARVTLLFEDGTSVSKTFALAPTSRTNVAVADEFADTRERFGAMIESLGDTPAEIVVERAMYSNAAGVHWAAGTNALATKLR